MSELQALSFAALTYAFTRPKNHKVFASQAVAYLNRMASFRDNLNHRKIIISPKAFTAAHEERRCMLELIFKESDSHISRKEELRTPFAFTEGLARRGIREVVLKTGINERQLELFLNQVCQRGTTLNKFNSIDIYLTKFDLRSYRKLVEQVDSFFKNDEEDKCVIFFPVPVIVNGFNSYSLGFYFKKGEATVKSRMREEMLRQPDALAERMVNRGIRQLIFKPGFNVDNIEDLILHVCEPEKWSPSGPSIVT